MTTAWPLVPGVAALILAALWTPPAAGEILMSDWVIDQKDRSQPLDGARAVSIMNPHGDIRVRGGGDGEVALYATIQHHKDDTAVPDFIFTHGDQLAVEVVYPDPPEGTLPARFARRRTDIALFVPAGLELALTTLDGRAESKGHEGHLVIETRDGLVNAAVKGTVDIRTRTGKVKVEFRNRLWSGPSRIESVSGDIDVFMMSDPNVNAQIDTAGAITTDYSIDISHTPGSRRKIAVAVIGSGEHDLVIRSRVGAVRLGRVFDMVPAAQPPIRPPRADGG